MTEKFKNLSGKQKLGYIFDYYKAPIIIVLSAALVLSYFLYDHFTKEKFDAEIIYAGSGYFTSEYESAVSSLASLGVDADNDGGEKLKFDQFSYTDIYGAEYKVTMTVTLINIVRSGKENILWLDSERLSAVLSECEDYLVPKDEWAPGAESQDSYSVDLSESAVLKEKGIPADGVYMVVVRAKHPESAKNQNTLKIAGKIANEN